ncbi:hypothetical protein ACJX0J_007292, partial [Zea mays]
KWNNHHWIFISATYSLMNCCVLGFLRPFFTDDIVSISHHISFITSTCGFIILSSFKKSLWVTENSSLTNFLLVLSLVIHIDANIHFQNPDLNGGMNLDMGVG